MFSFRSFPRWRRQLLFPPLLAHCEAKERGEELEGRPRFSLYTPFPKHPKTEDKDMLVSVASFPPPNPFLLKSTPGDRSKGGEEPPELKGGEAYKESELDLARTPSSLGQLRPRQLKKMTDIQNYKDMIGWHVLSANQPCEDRVSVQEISINGETFLFFGIFDGHGGWEVAQFLGLYLCRLLTDALASPLGSTSSPPPRLGKEEVEVAWKEAYRMLEQKLLKIVSAKNFNPAESFRLGQIGACSLSIVLNDDFVSCANTGDSKALLCRRGGEVLALNRRHSATDANEVRRLFDEHPEEENLVTCLQRSIWKDRKTKKVMVSELDGCYVKGRLQPTRSIGDFFMKSKEIGKRYPKVVDGPYLPPYLSGDPELISVKRLKRERGEETPKSFWASYFGGGKSEREERYLDHPLPWGVTKVGDHGVLPPENSLPSLDTPPPPPGSPPLSFPPSSPSDEKTMNRMDTQRVRNSTLEATFQNLRSESNGRQESASSTPADLPESSPSSPPGCIGLCDSEEEPEKDPGEFLIIASDGLWDVLDERFIVSSVHNLLYEGRLPSEVALFLSEEVERKAAKMSGFPLERLKKLPKGQKRPFHDDTSILIVCLQRPLSPLLPPQDISFPFPEDEPEELKRKRKGWVETLKNLPFIEDGLVRREMAEKMETKHITHEK